MVEEGLRCEGVRGRGGEGVLGWVAMWRLWREKARGCLAKGGWGPRWGGRGERRQGGARQGAARSRAVGGKEGACEAVRGRYSQGRGVAATCFPTHGHYGFASHVPICKLNSATFFKI